MNVLLFLPGLCVVLFRGQGAVGALFSLALIGAVQGVIGLPFLLHDAHAYAMAAFDFSRVFLFKWTVNWRFLGEALFLDPRTAKALLGVHLLLLLLFGLYTWTGLGTQGFSWIWRRWRGDRRLDLTPQCTSPPPFSHRHHLDAVHEQFDRCRAGAQPTLPVLQLVCTHPPPPCMGLVAVAPAKVRHPTDLD